MTRTLFTISPTRPFVDALAQGLLREAEASAGGRAALADWLVLLPTRRACRALREAFLRASDGRALLLPRLRPIGDIDEEEMLLAAAGGASMAAADLLEVPPAIAPMRRRFLLARLIMRLPDLGGTGDGADAAAADRALMLADELARLLDQVQTEGLSLDAVEKLVPDLYADHWRITVTFLEILRTHWPAVLAAEGAIDPADRRNRLLRAQAEAWRENPPDHPVVAAGSTGSIPATADLLAAVAAMPRGRVVLPGLDRFLSPADWETVAGDPAHPQHGLALLLRRLGADRDDVADWPEAAVDGPDERAPRARLIAEALRPAETTGAWRRSAELDGSAADGLAWLEASSAAAEAGAIALRLREALEIPGRTAALVTPDRNLARRVSAALARWGVAVDDSAGRPLANTESGIFFRLTAEAARTGFAPVPLLALLKHPLAGLGMEPAQLRRDIRYLERALLRGPKPGRGAEGLRAALAEATADPFKKRWVDVGRIEALIARIEAALAPLTQALEASGPQPLAALIDAHTAAAEVVAASDAAPGAERLWRGEDGEALATLVAEALDVAAAPDGFEPIPGGDYPAVLEALMSGAAVRPAYGRHPRVFIWGPLEARLQHADLVILGGLNEGVWPPEPEADPWMSRPMRRDFGLPPQERRIGLAAHDFAQAFAAPEVLLTRAAKVDGAPTVPSRWLERLAVVAARAGLGDRLAPNLPAARRLIDWNDALNGPGDDIDGAPLKPPAPCPPVAARPRRLSVTRVEAWMRDPYTIFAQKILGLEPLEEIDADFGAAERGSFIHDALERFVRDNPPNRPWPEDALARLLAAGELAFGAHALARPEIRAFWWPRFVRAARWFAAAERARRDGDPGLVQSLVEIAGEMTIPAAGGVFTLTAKADRIDRLQGGALAILDYKTGQPPGKKDLESGYAPQLPLEAAIATAGGFAGVPAGTAVGELAFWRLSGGDPPGAIQTPKVDVATLAEEARAGLERLVAAFDDPAHPYTAVPRPGRAPRFNDYAHLARVLEWARADGGEG